MSETSHVIPCVNLCETTSPRANADDLVGILTQTCWEAGFPGCERVYVGSYFCENYFCGLPGSFHVAVREICACHDMGATLVIPIIGQAFIDRTERRVRELLHAFDDVYDEVVVNDVAAFMWLAERTDKRIGLGRLFSKGLRDARYPEVFAGTSRPRLSPEAIACLQAQPGTCALVEVDPASEVVDVSGIVNEAAALEGAAYEALPASVSQGADAHGVVEIAMHLPYCYATTGRNCSAASIDEPDSEKFRLGRGCRHHCLRMAQGSRTEQGVRYIKHGRTYYYENPLCRIAGADSWRIIYAASNETMR